ncbi:UNVERIFIED_CONTAM: hypothetical protein HHA_263120 [Hammondia hammondi]|eukprot:XP_008882806.1 hypothetical protein HHA_263120 [Hammondia hammondi]
MGRRQAFGLSLFFSSVFFLFFSLLGSLQVSAGVRLRSFSGRNVGVLPLSPLRWTQAGLPFSLARGVTVRVRAAPECVAFAERPAWISEIGTTEHVGSWSSPVSPVSPSFSSFSSSSSLRSSAFSSPRSSSSSSFSSPLFPLSSSVLRFAAATAVHRPAGLLAVLGSLCRDATFLHVSSDAFSRRLRASVSSSFPPLHASTFLWGPRGPERKGRRKEQGSTSGNTSRLASCMRVSETERVTRRGNVTPADHLPQALSLSAWTSPSLPSAACFLRPSASPLSRSSSAHSLSPLSRAAARFLPPPSSSFASSRLFSSTASSAADASGEKRETGDEGEEDVRWRGQVRYTDPLRDALEGRETATEREQATLFSNDVFFEFCGSLGDDESLQEAADRALRRKKAMRKHFDDMLAYGRRMCPKQSKNKRDEEASASDAEGELSGEKSGDRHEQEDEAQLVERGRTHAGRDEHGEGRVRVSSHNADPEKDGGRPASRGEGEGLSEKTDRNRGEIQAESQNRNRDKQAGDQGAEQEATHASSDSHDPGTSRNLGEQRGKEFKGFPFLTSENCREDGKTESSASPHLADASSSSFSSSSSTSSPGNPSGTWFEAHEAQVGHFMKRTRARAWGEKLRIGDKDVTLVSEAWGRSPNAQAKGEKGERKSRQKPALRLPEADEKAGEGVVFFDDEDDQDLPDIVQSPNRAAWLEETWIEGGDSYTRSSASSSSSSSQCLDGLDFFGAAGGWRSCRRTVEEVDSDMDAMIEENEGSARRELFDAFEEISEKDEAIKQLLDSRPRRQTRADCGVFGESEETAEGEATAADIAQRSSCLWAETEGLSWGEEGETEAGHALEADSKVEDAGWESGCGEEGGQEGRERGRADEKQSVEPKSGRDDVWQIVAQATETERPDSGFWES